MSDQCQSQLQAAADALGNYRAAQAKAERLDRQVATATNGSIFSNVLAVLADEAGRDDIEAQAGQLHDRMEELEGFLEELQGQAEQDAQDALSTLDDALDAYCDCIRASNEPAQAIDPGDDEDEEDEDDPWDDIDDMIEELKHEFEELEDDLLGDE
jgi:chromosome segregation ATPase